MGFDSLGRMDRASVDPPSRLRRLGREDTEHDFARLDDPRDPLLGEAGDEFQTRRLPRFPGISPGHEDLGRESPFTPHSHDLAERRAVDPVLDAVGAKDASQIGGVERRPIPRKAGEGEVGLEPIVTDGDADLSPLSLAAPAEHLPCPPSQEAR